MRQSLEEYPLREFASSLEKKPNFRVADYSKDADFVTPFSLSLAQQELGEMSSLLDKLDGLVRAPHLESKREELILRQEESGALSPESIRATISDSALWRRKRGAFSPEYVHADSVADAVVTYENRLVCSLLDSMLGEIDGLLQASLPLAENLRKRYEGAEASYGPYGVFAQAAQKAPAQSRSKAKDGDLQAFQGELSRLKNRVRQLMATRFYHDVSPYPFVGPLVPTNLFLHDPLYHAAYRYALEHQSLGAASSKGDDAYRNYALARLLCFLFAHEKKQPSLHYESGLLRLQPIVFSHGLFEIACQEEGMDLLLCVRLSKQETPSFIHRLVFAALDASRAQAARDPFEETVFVCPKEVEAKEAGVLTLSPFEEADDHLAAFLASLTFVLPNSSSDRCPVCGDAHLIYSSGAAICQACHSSFVFLDSSRVWIGRLGRQSGWSK